jgi:hypothetical protein
MIAPPRTCHILQNLGFRVVQVIMSLASGRSRDHVTGGPNLYSPDAVSSKYSCIAAWNIQSFSRPRLVQGNPVLTSQNLNIAIRAAIGRKERFQHLRKLTRETKDMTYSQSSDACHLDRKRLVLKRTLTLREKASF